VPTGPMVMVLVPMQDRFARQIVRGARAYVVAHQPWWLRCGGLTSVDGLRKLCAAADGVVAFFGNPDHEQAVLDAGVPAVNVSSRLADTRLPLVQPDHRAIGRIAAAHLLDRGFERFAFAGPVGHGYAAARLAGFEAAVGGAGFTCEVAPQSVALRHGWIAGLPTPVGVLAANDTEARRAADYCHELDIAVPEQVAIVGVDDDPDICESSHVSISSIDTRGFEVGERAAALLADLMGGDPPPQEPILIPPGELTVRRSTDVVAVADPDLAFTMRYIREHACDPLRVEEVLAHLTVSRRTLEKRFKAAFGRTLHNEIRRNQLERARQLLRTTDLRVPDVSRKVGFADDRMFTKVFGEAVGMPPGKFRDANRAR